MRILYTSKCLWNCLTGINTNISDRYEIMHLKEHTTMHCFLTPSSAQSLAKMGMVLKYPTSL